MRVATAGAIFILFALAPGATASLMVGSSDHESSKSIVLDDYAAAQRTTHSLDTIHLALTFSASVPSTYTWLLQPNLGQVANPGWNLYESVTLRDSNGQVVDTLTQDHPEATTPIVVNSIATTYQVDLKVRNLNDSTWKLVQDAMQEAASMGVPREHGQNEVRAWLSLRNEAFTTAESNGTTLDIQEINNFALVHSLSREPLRAVLRVNDGAVVSRSDSAAIFLAATTSQDQQARYAFSVSGELAKHAIELYEESGKPIMMVNGTIVAMSHLEANATSITVLLSPGDHDIRARVLNANGPISGVLTFQSLNTQVISTLTIKEQSFGSGFGLVIGISISTLAGGSFAFFAWRRRRPTRPQRVPKPKPLRAPPAPTPAAPPARDDLETIRIE